jgi:integrase/recombinase XerD
VIALNAELADALKAWRDRCWVIDGNERVIATERSKTTSSQVVVNLFRDWYRELGLEGCSSHSGRRTFITSAAKKISLVGGNLLGCRSHTTFEVFEA